MTNKEEIVLNNIYNRKSVRRFTDEKITKEDLIKIIRAGMSAPSTCNFQPWHFIVIQDEKTLKDMTTIHENAGMFKQAAAGIIVLGDITKVLSGAEEFWMEDCSAATENILLATEALGLGAVWTGIYPETRRTRKLKEYLNLPNNIIPFSLIALGHPDGQQYVQDKWDETKLHWEKW